MKILENILGGLLVYALAVVAFTGISAAIVLGGMLFFLHFEVALTIAILSTYAYLRYDKWRKTKRGERLMRELEEKRNWD